MVGAQLRAVREEAGLSQSALGARIGLSGVQVSRIETGARSTSIDVVHRWYQACGYALDAVQVGTSEQATNLTIAVAAIGDDQLDAVIAVLRAWPRLDERSRGRILGIVESSKQ